MAPKTVLITGCSSGIGLATAVLLAKETQHEFKVYATMRNLESKDDLVSAAGDALDKTLFIRALDVTKEDTISSVVDEILRDNGRIDVLVNNAGYCAGDGFDQKPLEWCQAMMDTNYWGVVRTTRAVLPAMKKQQLGRILNVTSISGILGWPFFATYSSSKFAVEGFVESMASVLRKVYNISVILVEPGPVQTRLITKLAADSEKDIPGVDETLQTLYRRQMEVLREHVSSMIQSPEEIARLHLEIILSEEPHLRYQTSQAWTTLAETKLRDATTDGLLKA